MTARKIRTQHNTEPKLLSIDGLVIELTRKPIKRINLRITAKPGARDGVRIAVSAPWGTRERDITAFIRCHRDWITRNAAKVQARATRNQEPETEAEKKEAREKLRVRIARRLPEIEQITGLRSNGWTIRDMHTRWGSCNTKTHHLNFSLMLADRTDEELDYVILHELAHTKVPGHGSDFYALMDRFMPGWKQIRKQLKN